MSQILGSVGLYGTGFEIQVVKWIALFQWMKLFSGQINQSARYVHRCLQHVVLIKTCTNNSGQESEVVESEDSRNNDLGYKLVHRCSH